MCFDDDFCKYGSALFGLAFGDETLLTLSLMLDDFLYPVIELLFFLYNNCDKMSKSVYNSPISIGVCLGLYKYSTYMNLIWSNIFVSIGVSFE